MEKRYALENSYGIMRVREVLKDEKEREIFEVALGNVLCIYYDRYYNKDTRLPFNSLNLLEDEELKLHIKDISTVYNTAKNNRIYMDRPYDNICSFIYEAAKVLL